MPLFPVPMKSAVQVCPGQVWMDTIRLARFRLLKVERVEGRHVFMTVIRDDDKPEWIGKPARATLERFEPYSDGYRLWSDENGRLTFNDDSEN